MTSILSSPPTPKQFPHRHPPSPPPPLISNQQPRQLCTSDNVKTNMIITSKTVQLFANENKKNESINGSKCHRISSIKGYFTFVCAKLATSDT